MHIEAETLRAIARGVLEEEVASVEHHLRECAACWAAAQAAQQEAVDYDLFAVDVLDSI
jgi:hypothetical protein